MAVAVHDGAIFRTCDVTGFKVDLRAEKIARLNAVVAVVSFLIAIIAALLLVLTRWQMFHILPVDWYYRVLTLHGLDGLVFWIIFFELAALVFGSTAFLNTRMSSPAAGWLGTILAIVGWLMVNYTILTGNADVLMTSYAPLKAHPLFYLGMILFAVGAHPSVVHGHNRRHRSGCLQAGMVGTGSPLPADKRLRSRSRMVSSCLSHRGWNFNK